MTLYRVECTETTRTIYHIKASDPDDARAKMENGQATNPVFSEAEDVEIIRVVEL